MCVCVCVGAPRYTMLIFRFSSLWFSCVCPLYISVYISIYVIQYTIHTTLLIEESKA